MYFFIHMLTCESTNSHPQICAFIYVLIFYICINKYLLFLKISEPKLPKIINVRGGRDTDKSWLLFEFLLWSNVNVLHN